MNINVLEHNVVYENPYPQLMSRHGYFPGIEKLPSGELLTLFSVGEAFEAKMVICSSISKDMGASWSKPEPVFGDFEIGLGSMKPTLLANGDLVAVGYGIDRDEPKSFLEPVLDTPLGGKNYISFSKDAGKSWSRPELLLDDDLGLLETSGQCIQLANGDLLATGARFGVWSESNPADYSLYLLRSCDNGKSWKNEGSCFMQKDVSPFETRLCQMPNGVIAVIIWRLNEVLGKSLTNAVIFSDDNGKTWQEPIDTKVPAQASNLISYKDNLALSVHSYREGEVGLYVKIVDLSNNEWKELTSKNVWDKSESSKISSLKDMGANLKFGQPSIMPLGNDEFLAIHWAIEGGQGRILSHKFSVTA